MIVGFSLQDLLTVKSEMSIRCIDELNHTKSSYSYLKRECFSFTELLVVLSIFTVMISLLSPSLRSLYRKSQKISCQKHLSAYGVAEHMHAEDHDGFLPPMAVAGVGNWFANDKFISYFDKNKRPVCSSGGQYGMNTWTPWLKGRKTKAININNLGLAAQKKVRYADGTWPFIAGYYNISSAWVSKGESASRQPAFRHLDTANAVYFDGHLESLDLVEHFDTQLKEENFKYDISIEQIFSYNK